MLAYECNIETVQGAHAISCLDLSSSLLWLPALLAGVHFSEAPDQLGELYVQVVVVMPSPTLFGV